MSEGSCSYKVVKSRPPNPNPSPTPPQPRDQNEVLAEDRDKLRALQPLQPWFSQEQREELAEVHPWIQQHTIPPEIDTQVGGENTHTHAHP